MWEKQCYSIPSGATICTDGSLIDGKLPRSCQALGWAFAVANEAEDLVAAAHGVPPRWVDTIQGAEMWAAQIALQYVLSPDRLYTDCDSVRLGSKRSIQWASSSKRRFARIWIVICNQLQDDNDVVQWIPYLRSEYWRADLQ